MSESGGTKAQASAPSPRGVPYAPSLAHPVTEWSAAVYAELSDWPVAQAGKWERWAPEYLVLTINSYEGRAAEPVVIDTYEDELTITFGFWEAHLPNDGIYDDTDSHRAAIAAKTLTLDWLEGRIATAVYFNADGNWCGSKLLTAPDHTSTLSDIAWIKDFEPARVEVRRSNRSEWLEFAISDGSLNRLS